MSIAQPVPLFFYVYNVATFEALLRNFRNCISRIPCHGINRRNISGFEGRASIENLRSSFYVCVYVSGYGAVIVQASINRRFDTRDLVKYAMTTFTPLCFLVTSQDSPTGIRITRVGFKQSRIINFLPATKVVVALPFVRFHNLVVERLSILEFSLLLFPFIKFTLSVLLYSRLFVCISCILSLANLIQMELSTVAANFDRKYNPESARTTRGVATTHLRALRLDVAVGEFALCPPILCIEIASTQFTKPEEKLEDSRGTHQP